jgi:HK97 family phage prohead protease
MERKVIEATSLKFVAEGPGGFSGYASTFANFDRVGERPTKGAFAPHLADFLRDGFVSVGHDWTVQVATVTKALEDDIGLYVEGEFHTTPFAQQTRTIVQERLERGKSVKLSIGYEVLLAEDTDEGRLLKDVKLYEFSFVSVPANPLAIVTGAKSGEVSTLGFDEHGALVATINAAFAERAVGRYEFRTKDGRVLSTANFTTLEQAYESIGKVLESARRATPEDSEKQLTETERLRTQWVINQFRLSQIGVKTT